MAFVRADSKQVAELVRQFGVEPNNCERLVIDIKVGEVVRAYANVIGDIGDGDSFSNIATSVRRPFRSHRMFEHGRYV